MTATPAADIRRRHHWKDNPAIVVLLVGTLLHAAVLFVVLPIVGPWLGQHYGAGFADDYAELARNIAAGNGYRFTPDTAETLLREPGYPFLLAAVFSVFGDSLPAARLLNLIFMMGTAWLLIVMARESSHGRWLAALAVALFLVHPGILLGEARAGFEALYAFCLTLLAWRLSRALSSRRAVDYFWAGAALGLGVLVRSSLIAFPAIVLAWLLLQRNAAPWSVTLGNLVVLSLAMCLVIAPWAIRNYRVAHAVVPTATISGIAMHVGEYVCRHRDSGRSLVDLDAGARDERAAIARSAGYRFNDQYFPQFYSVNDEVEFSQNLQRRAVDYYLSVPADFAKCASLNLLNFWVAGKGTLATILNAAVQIPYVLLALCGAIALRRTSEPRVVAILLIVVYTMLVHAATFAQARYSVPLVPLLSLLGAYALARWWTDMQNRTRIGH